MDHMVHGVRATVIDLGLARMDSHDDGNTVTVQWTTLAEEVFDGEGI